MSDTPTVSARMQALVNAFEQAIYTYIRVGMARDFSRVDVNAKAALCTAIAELEAMSPVSTASKSVSINEENIDTSTIIADAMGFTDKQRADFARHLAAAEAELKPFDEAVRRSTHISGEDMAIRINARDDDPSTPGGEMPTRIKDAVDFAQEDIADDLAALAKAVGAQAEDKGLWFLTRSASEAYLQQELRKIHALIESLLGRTP
jgi:hypothetical protein